MGGIYGLFLLHVCVVLSITVCMALFNEEKLKATKQKYKILSFSLKF